MTQEPTSNESTPPAKLMIDDPSDFRYHAAYLAYSDVFDKMSNVEAKKQLNDSVLALRQSQIGYEGFYEKIDQYRARDGSQYHPGKAFIKTQKKREWRRKTQKHERIKRHRK